MPSVIISSGGPAPSTPAFGLMTNQCVAALYRANQALERLQNAVTAAASGYTGVPGTEYEGSNTNFGIVGDPNNPGARGQDYQYAVNSLAEAWQTFWTQASGAIQQLDNGASLTVM